ncbi:hypothetical protein C8Q75DRAFT_736624 [Abortiporus biennis]|nr:hypothetical protein C8Q75DRAFT_736624 [Abortiporus biennis]
MLNYTTTILVIALSLCAVLISLVALFFRCMLKTSYRPRCIVKVKEPSDNDSEVNMMSEENQDKGCTVVREVRHSRGVSIIQSTTVPVLEKGQGNKEKNLSMDVDLEKGCVVQVEDKGSTHA